MLSLNKLYNTPSQSGSKFARSSQSQLVYEDKSLTDCINMFPVELKREILSYLPMGIILTLYEQPKKVILYCLKQERMDRGKGFSSIFQEYSGPALIELILRTDEINKKYIMRHFIDLKKREMKKKKHDELKLIKQIEIASQLGPGDYFMSDKNINYIIVKKTKCTLQCISLGTEINYMTNPVTIKISNRMSILKFASICIPVLPEKCIINRWLQKVVELNQAPIVRVNMRMNTGEGPQLLGTMSKENVLPLIT